MHVVRHLDDLPPSMTGGAVTIGNFDGVHRGHAMIIHRLCELARGQEGPATVFTFDPHPVRLLRPHEAPAPLTWSERKAILLERLGVEVMVIYPTDESLLALEADAFFQQIVIDRLRARAMVEGPNFYFGRGRSGNIEHLQRLCTDHAVVLNIVEPLLVGADYVSSSRVRKAVSAGEVEVAAAQLTEPYRIRGMVTHGAARGARLGFPTANISAVDTLLPAVGVYAGRAYRNGQWYPSAVNIGPNPTFGEDLLKVEAHLLHFDGSLYGEPLEVDFLKRLRDIRPFSSVDELKSQLAKDVEETRRICEATL